MPENTDRYRGYSTASKSPSRDYSSPLDPFGGASAGGAEFDPDEGPPPLAPLANRPEHECPIPLDITAPIAGREEEVGTGTAQQWTDQAINQKNTNRGAAWQRPTLRLDPNRLIPLQSGGYAALAPPLRRLQAFIIDAIPATFFGYIVVMSSLYLNTAKEPSEQPQVLIWFFIGAIGLLALIGIQLSLLISRSQTLGKMALKTKLIHQEGRPALGIQTVFTRIFMFYIAVVAIPVFGLFLLPIDILSVFSKKHQRVRDHMAKTVVVLDPDVFPAAPADGLP